jgi:hypothetical protein
MAGARLPRVAAGRCVLRALHPPTEGDPMTAWAFRSGGCGCATEDGGDGFGQKVHVHIEPCDLLVPAASETDGTEAHDHTWAERDAATQVCTACGDTRPLLRWYVSTTDPGRST